MLNMWNGKRGGGNFLQLAGLLTALSLLAGGGRLLASASSEQALRTRVEQFYTALQQGNFPQAEKFLPKEARSFFRAQPPKPVATFQIDSIKLDSGGETATVVVKVPTVLPFTDQSLLMGQTTQWRRLRGVWYLQFEKAEAQAPQAPFNPSLHSPLPPPPRVTAPVDLKFQTNSVALSWAHLGEVKVASFPFTNVSNHNVTLAEVQTGCDCLRLKTQQKEFKPGEAGVLEFELDASKMPAYGALNLTVLVKTEPENTYKLFVGSVLLPGPAPPAGP